MSEWFLTIQQLSWHWADFAFLLSQLDRGMPFEHTPNQGNTSSTWLMPVSNPLLGPLFIRDQWFFIEVTFPQQDRKSLLSGSARCTFGQRTGSDECWVSNGSLSSFWSWGITSFGNVHKFIQTNLGSFPAVFLQHLPCLSIITLLM